MASAARFLPFQLQVRAQRRWELFSTHHTEETARRARRRLQTAKGLDPADLRIIAISDPRFFSPCPSDSLSA